MWSRWIRHLTLTQRALRHAFPESVLLAVTAAVRDSERAHGGEIRVAIEADWPLPALWRGLTTRQRALQVFDQLGVANSRARNGVLIYLAFADRQVELVADQGLTALVSQAQWDAVCRDMEVALTQARYEDALCLAVRQAGAILARHFPAADRNEQPDRPVLL